MDTLAERLPRGGKDDGETVHAEDPRGLEAEVAVEPQPPRHIAASVGISAGAVSELVTRARDAQLDLIAVEKMSDVELEKLLYGEPLQAGLQLPSRTRCISTPSAVGPA